LHYGPYKYRIYEYYGCGAIDHKLADCPIKAWNRPGNVQDSGMGTNPVTQRDRPPMNTTSGGNRGGKRPQIGGQVFCPEGEEAEKLTTTISDTVLIQHLYTHVLFDSGATHSFVNPVFAKKLASKPNEMDVPLYVTTPLGSTYYTDVVFKNYTIQLEGRIVPVDLLQLDIQG